MVQHLPPLQALTVGLGRFMVAEFLGTSALDTSMARHDATTTAGKYSFSRVTIQHFGAQQARGQVFGPAVTRAPLGRPILTVPLRCQRHHQLVPLLGLFISWSLLDLTLGPLVF